MRCFGAGKKSSSVIHSIDSSSRSIRRLVQTERQDFTYTRRPPPGPLEQRSRRCTEKEGITRKLSSVEFGWSYVSLKNIISLWVSDTIDSRRENLPNTLQQFSWDIIFGEIVEVVWLFVFAMDSRHPVFVFSQRPTWSVLRSVFIYLRGSHLLSSQYIDHRVRT